MEGGRPLHPPRERVPLGLPLSHADTLTVR